MPKNTGPDGVNRCGFMRGKKCEQDRYNEEMAAKADNEAKVIQAQAEADAKKAASNNKTTSPLMANFENNKNLIVISVIVIVIIIAVVIYFKMKK